MIVMLCANHTPDFLIHAMRAGVREVLKSPVTKEVLLVPWSASSSGSVSRRGRVTRHDCGFHPLQGRRRDDIHRH